MATRLKTLADTFRSRLLGWYDAQDAATLRNAAGNQAASGDPVAQWLDKSVSSGARTGTAYPVAQATTTKRPPLNATALNGYPALVFNPAFAHFLFNTSLTTTQPFTIISVFQRTNVQNNSYTGNRRLIGSHNNYNSISTNNLYVQFYNSGWQPIDTTVNDPRLAIATFNGPASFRGDGQAGTLNNNGSGTGVLTGLDIGATSNGSETHEGPISEVAIILDAMTLAEAQEAEGILLWKWGYQSRLPANHLYKAAAPTVTTAETETARRRPLILM